MQAGFLPRAAMGLLSAACLLHGQSPSETRLSFEVASVKAAAPAPGPGKGEPQAAISITPGNLTMRNASLREMIVTAYGIRDYQLSGPDWMKSVRFDVVAKATGGAQAADIRSMLQGLLAERFKLTVHRQTKDLAVDVLALGKSAPKFGPQKAEGPNSVAIEGSKMVFQNFSVTTLADYLSLRSPERPVVDATEIEGYYDFAIQLLEGGSDNPGDVKRAMGQAMRDGSLPRMVAEQLGLKLETRKGPTEIVVVDHAERAATEN